MEIFLKFGHFIFELEHMTIEWLDIIFKIKVVQLTQHNTFLGRFFMYRSLEYIIITSLTINSRREQ